MSFSLYILSLGKRELIEVPEYTTFDIIDESDEYNGRCAGYEFMTMQEGQWFLICGKEPDVAAYTVCTIDVDKVEGGQVKYPSWVDNEYTIGDLFPLIIYDEVFDEFEHVLRYMLEQSPLNKIMFLARLQGTYEEIVCGTMQVDKFVSMLKDREILFNTCYIVSKESTIPDFVPSINDEFSPDDFRPWNGRFYYRD